MEELVATELTLVTPTPPGMDEEEFQSLVDAEVQDAISWIDEHIATKRKDAGKIYRGEKYGTERPGQSQIVTRDVRDTIQQMLPSLMRIFCGGDRPVEFVPRGKEDIEKADQASEYVSYIVNEDNPGFLLHYFAFKDALLNSHAIWKYWWEQKETVESCQYTGLDQMALDAVMTDQYGTEDLQVTQEPDGTFSVALKRRNKNGKVRIACVPPEEFLIDRHATDVENARLVGHRTILTRSELIQMGYSPEDLDEVGTYNALDTAQERVARSPWLTTPGQSIGNEALDRYEYYELYIRADRDGDGIAELRRVCAIGDARKILREQEWDAPGFVVFGQDPESHTSPLEGQGVTDQVSDIQKIKTHVMRSMLDSLAQTVNPRTAVLEGAVNLADVLNNEVGGIVRERVSGAVRPLAQPFVGQAAFPVLDYLDATKEQRTGMSRASQGLDAEVLQSTTRKAVDATVEAAQAHIEMIARMFAETGMKPLYKGILRLVCKHQDQPRIVRLRNKFVPIDPRAWDSNMDVSVNVGLGAGTEGEKLQKLAAIAQKQELILQALGPSNPLVTPRNYSNALRQMVIMAGFKDPSAFFGEIPEGYQPPQPQGGPSGQDQAALILAQAQTQQISAEVQMSREKLMLEAEKMRRADDRERDRVEADIVLRRQEMELKYGVQLQQAQAQIDAKIAMNREQMAMQPASSEGV